MNIYDIAKLAGVSYATVSRVINNKDDVKQETRERVQKILDEHGYLPNSFARGLSMSGMKLIGILLIDVRNLHHSNTAFHIETEFAKFGYTSFIAGCGLDNTKQEEYLRVMASRNVDGLVLIGSRFQNEETRKNIKKYFSGKPVVIANGYLDLPNVCGIVDEERKAVAGVVDLLVSRGHRNIAFVNDYVTFSAQEKEAGFMEGIERNNILYNENNIRHIKTDIDVSIVESEKLFSLNRDITAAIYSEDLMAVGGVKACGRLNLKIPDDISIIGFNNSIYSDVSTPRISTIDNKRYDLGAKCTDALYAMLKGKKVEPVVKIIPELIHKETTNLIE
ncbi:LacI family DNA-binding transcriptional regulator [Spirochaeta isovalerica]|uniref:LacI family transcriptional regulator n=1 Tax=Spirochaeta isovalerica TaxID=150 RepID=A0A841RA78_9SPIO|nr:LacI family DNA-binding transcriptional regulator [Spirochaeta isovalerica]MBB6480646.1 LacI family transcriptional regulator [Spirochaeta isovalerica]